MSRIVDDHALKDASLIDSSDTDLDPQMPIQQTVPKPLGEQLVGES